MKTLNYSALLMRLADTAKCAGFIVLAVMLFSVSLAQATTAGTVITNQAEANYVDSITHQAAHLTSNIVEVEAQPVAAFILSAPQSRVVNAGATYYLPHQIKNTGNSADNYNLSAAVSGGNLVLNNVKVYADANGDGVPDNMTPLTNTGSIAPGATFNVVISVTVGAASVINSAGQLTITASSATASSQSNIDTLNLSGGAVLSVTKTFSVIQGPSPNINGGAYIAVTLIFANTSNSTASNVSFTDTIGSVNSQPAYNTSGMHYIAGTGRWNGLNLTDMAGYDPAGISYSAITTGGVTAINGQIFSLAPGESARVVFSVEILPNLPLGSAQTNNITHVVYSDGMNTQSMDSNMAVYNVLSTATPRPDLTLSKTHAGDFTMGLPGTFNLKVSNTGTGATTGTVTVSDTLPVGLNYVPASSGGNGWTCNATGQSVVCSSSAIINPGADAANLPITVIPVAKAQTYQLTNTAQDSGGGEPPGNAVNNTASDTVNIVLAATVSGRVWLDANHNNIYDTGEALVPGVKAELYNSARVLVGSAITDANGAYMIGPVMPGTGFYLLFRDPVSGALFATPVNGEKGTPTSSATVNSKAGELQNLDLAPGTNVVEQSLPLDPSGVVYDSITRQPVPGAMVTLSGPAGFDPATQLMGGAGNATQTVGVTGFYQFVLLGGAQDGVYTLKVVAPAGYISPSKLIPVQPSALPFQAGVGKYAVQVQSTAPQVGSFTTYYLAVNMGQGGKDIVNNHIPIDPVIVAGSGLLVSKTASRSTAEPGDFVDYTIVIKNTTTIDLPTTQLQDNLPVGFRYVKGTARLNTVALADPLGSPGPALHFAVGTLTAGSSVTLTYRVAVGIAASGMAINHAQAVSGVAMSNVASAAVQIVPGVFSDKAYLIGTVYLDCNRNHFQDPDEKGIPGVRLFLEDGTHVTTDIDGKYSLYGLDPATHALKLDKSTLPAGAVLEVLANRNAGVASSRFADLKNGELHRADFASDTCNEGVVKEVDLRRAKLKNNEFDRALSVKLTPLVAALTPVDNRGLPAAGELGEVPGSFQPMAQGLNSGNSNLPASPVAAIPMIDMDAMLPDVDNSFGFMILKDKDVLPFAQTNVLVKGVSGSEFTLSVNDQLIDASRVGKRSTIMDKKLQAWQYIGVTLKPGKNILTIKQLDQFGNERDSRSITVVAPDNIGHIVLDAPKTVEANGRVEFKVKVHLVDEHNVPVTSRTYLTLESGLATWQVKDLNPKEPGVQVFIEGGEAEYMVMPPALPGAESLRVSSGVIKAEQPIAYIPELRPMIATGIIEGAFNTHSLKAAQLMPVDANDSFDKQISRAAGGGDTPGARAALFLKGKVKGDYLLTLAYDSGKSKQATLFRDILPDQFYPVYGDSSIKGYDAQSTSRLYVRVDKGKSFLLYGDYVTQSTVPARALSQYNRSLTGIKEHYETDRLMVNAFASQTTSNQVIQEIPANGTSGPFQLNNNGAFIKSQTVEILTRDRNQPAMIISTVAQTLLSDFEIDQYTGIITFKGPIPSLDANLNPISIRITYEMDQGGKSFLVGGIDAQYKLTDKLEVGGVVVHDSNPLLPVTLKGVNASFKVTEKSVLVGEMARTDTVTGSGGAERAEWRVDDGALQGRIYSGRSDTAFNNPSSILNSGRRESGAKGTYKLDAKTTLKGEMIDSSDPTGTKNKGVLLAAERSMSDKLKLEVGARDSAAVQPGISEVHTTSLRLKATEQIPRISGLSVNGVYEQDVRDSSKKVVGMGAEYQLMNRGRIYANHEFISSLTNPFALNSVQSNNRTVFGIDADYTKDTHVFSEYRIGDGLDAAQSQAAVGLRNKWQLAEGLRLNTSAEHVMNVAQGVGRNSQAYTGAIEYTANPLWKGSFRLEYHDSETASGWLDTIDGARKLNNSWTIIGKQVFSENANKGATTGVRIQERLQGGLAWRDMDHHVWNVLSKIEHRREVDTTIAADTNRRVNIISVHANYQPKSDWQASAHYAAKWLTDQSSGLTSSSNAQLLAARLMWDVTERFDVGLNASLMEDIKSRATNYGMGVEAGYMVKENLWVTIGYNFFGYKEPDMVDQNSTDKGFMIRLRYKFDEELFKGILSKFNEKAAP
jgi:uncharacterized repeat protein (TIGR01451 family)